MSATSVFSSPFRLISRRLDPRDSRLGDLCESPAEDITCLEEGLIVMTTKLIEMTWLASQVFSSADPEKIAAAGTLGKEIHVEEKNLTVDMVSSPDKTINEVLKAVVLFPTRLERVGDLLESIVNVSRIKARDRVPFSLRAHAEVSQLFGLLLESLTNLRDALVNRNRVLVERVVAQDATVAQMVQDFHDGHEDRLVEGLCVPRASSMYVDILDSIRSANSHLKEISISLLKISDLLEVSQ